MEILLIVGFGYFMCIVTCYVMNRSEIEEFKNFLMESSKVDEDTECCAVDRDNNTISEYAWERSGKFEGDIILNEAQRLAIMEEVTMGVFRNGISNLTKRWPNGTLVYLIDNRKKTLDSGQINSIIRAFEYLEHVSCIKFKPYTRGDSNAVRIQGSARGCFSYIGMQGGFQPLNLNASHPAGLGCFSVPNIVHELLHSLGFYHMHSSSKRDDYITIKWENIKKNFSINFKKINSSLDFGVGYDFSSVMHYSRKAFSANGEDTIVPKQPVPVFGRRDFVSAKDIKKLNRMYQCGTD